MRGITGDNMIHNKLVVNGKLCVLEKGQREAKNEDLVI